MSCVAGNAGLINALKAIVGQGEVIDWADRMRPYCSGFRLGSGEAIAVVRCCLPQREATGAAPC